MSGERKVKNRWERMKDREGERERVKERIGEKGAVWMSGSARQF